MRREFVAVVVGPQRLVPQPPQRLAPIAAVYPHRSQAPASAPHVAALPVWVLAPLARIAPSHEGARRQRPLLARHEGAQDAALEAAEAPLRSTARRSLKRWRFSRHQTINVHKLPRSPSHALASRPQQPRHLSVLCPHAQHRQHTALGSPTSVPHARWHRCVAPLKERLVGDGLVPSVMRPPAGWLICACGTTGGG